MGLGDIHGRAKVSRTAPRGFAICDDCGDVYNLVDLQKQYDYRGPRLAYTGFKKCPRCLDTPQPQLKPILLPPDPVPLVEPRPDYPQVNFGLQGFTAYVIQPVDDPLTEAASILAAVAALSGIPTPPVLTDHAGTIANAGIAQALLPVNINRSWLLIYNPSNPQLGVSTGTAAFGATNLIVLGPGEALFWATAQGTNVYPGAMTAVGLLPGAAYDAWEA